MRHTPTPPAPERYIDLFPASYNRMACPSCGVDSGTQGARCAECEALRESYPFTKRMKVNHR